jgi:hypothetical protein
VSVWKIAENVVGISVPLVMEKVGKGTPDSARGGSPESEAKMGALPPLRSPFLGSGTTRILPEWSKIQRACR